MSHKPTIFARIRQFFWPARESYESRQARGGEPGAGLPPQYDHAPDRRRHGGSGQDFPG